MRLAGSLACLVLLAGFAPTPVTPPAADDGQARRCFASTDVQLVRFEPGSAAYVRTRSGHTLELGGSSSCLDVSDDPRIALRPIGLAGADICLGDALRLDISSAAAIQRTCNVRVIRAVPASEVAGIPGRRL